MLSALGAPRLHVEVLTEWPAPRELEDEWRTLADRSSTASAFQIPEFAAAWWHHFGEGRDPAVVAVREGVRLVGLAPLAVSRWEGVRHLGFIGSGLADYEDMLVDDDADRAAVVEAVVGSLRKLPRWDFLLTNRLREDSPNLEPLRRALERSGSRVVLRAFSVAPYAELSSTWTEFHEGLDLKLRRDSRRCARRLQEEHGPLVFREADPDVDEAIDSLVAMHRERRTGAKGDYSLFEDPRMSSFYRDLASRLAGAGVLDLSLLEAGGRTVAVHLGMRYMRRFYYLLPAMEQELARYSPGRLLLMHLFERSFERGDSVFDLLTGDEGYKASFAPARVRLMTLAAFPRTGRGLAAFVWFAHARPAAARVAGSRGGRFLRRHGLLGRFS